jgi:hypothetical protein
MIFIPDDFRDDWANWDFEGPRHPCFLCGAAVGEGKVAMWAGSGGAGTFVDDGSVVSEVLKRLEGVTAALYIYFHPTCIPSFTRRLLEDWEQVCLSKRT